MIFELKKLNTETLSEYLRLVRQDKGLSLQEVANKTGIKPKFLESLEDGEFLRLPADVYVMGFLKKLAALYSADPGILVEQYKKERGIQQQLRKPRATENIWKDKFLGKFVITPKSVSLALGLLFVAVTLGYIIWQVSSINKAPFLEIFEPKDRQIIQGSSVSVSGRTDPGMSVTVNGQDIFVDSSGNFKTQLGITAGQKELVVIARNKFDKAVTKAVSIVGEDTAAQAGGQVQLKLEFTGDVTLKVAIDSNPEQSQDFHNGDTEQYTGQKIIVVSTSDAGATKATLNDQPIGILGRPKESLNNISFFPGSAGVGNQEQ